MTKTIWIILIFHKLHNFFIYPTTNYEYAFNCINELITSKKYTVFLLLYEGNCILDATFTYVRHCKQICAYKHVCVRAHAHTHQWLATCNLEQAWPSWLKSNQGNSVLISNKYPPPITMRWAQSAKDRSNCKNSLFLRKTFCNVINTLNK
jgi:hypothetical protein